MCSDRGRGEKRVKENVYRGKMVMRWKAKAFLKFESCGIEISIIKIGSVFLERGKRTTTQFG
jgi:hypothetical protein